MAEAVRFAASAGLAVAVQLRQLGGALPNLAAGSGPERMARCYDPATSRRLTEVARRYDPAGVFRASA